MAEVKQNFLKSKMNKDLDDRLVPVGEYRHAQNISVAKSEGQDVGALENILGNNAVSNFALPDNTYGVEIIGQYMDVKNDRIIVFMTNYVDTSGSALNNFSPADAYHAIGMYEVLGGNSTILVTGRFLNFSKTHEIYGVNMIDNLLFWTDNRNQPRKINVLNARSSLACYTTEDTISVSKYYPYQAISLVTEEVTDATLTAGGLGYAAGINNVPTTGGSGTDLTIDILTVSATAIVTFSINNTGVGYQDGDVVNVVGQHGSGGQITLTVGIVSTMQDVVSDYLPDGTTDNPYRQPYDNTQDITWKGDPEYLKDKFVRFSYRFKFDDGEYSLIAPFTQTCFIPQQDGYFIGDDDARTFKSTEVEFMQNKVNDIDLILTSPIGNWDDLRDTMKIVEVDILYKEAGQNSIKVLDTLTQTYISNYPLPILTYNYASSKPWKTLPSSEVLRVHDQVPVRALAQEIIDNRVVYGNYIDKPTPPATINYSANVIHKSTNDKIEYQNQNLKQNRTYQVGVVLSDRYGRQSTVILSTIDDYNISSTIKGSTIFNKFKASPFSDYSSNGLFSATDAWDGDNLSLTFWAAISSGLSPNSLPNHDTGEPGLYNATTNPLGWYSYKIVVKQTEQDYYNIYFPGILNGYADGEAISTAATEKEPVCHFALHGDNINKVPRDLSLVGPNQKVFRTSRPTIQEDPSYYQFAGQQIDPYSDEGERLLKERDRERDLDAGSQVSNANVKLSLRLNNVAPDMSGSGLTAIDTTTAQGYPGINLDTVNTIGTGVELGLWDAAGKPPFNTANVFYGYKNNPYIAKITVSAPITAGTEIQTGLTGPHPLSGKLNHWIEAVSTFDGTSYVAGSKNVLCTIPDNPPGVDASTGSGFKVNIDADDSGSGTGMPTAVSVADIGGGWNPLMSAGHIGTSGGSPGDNVKITGAGDGDAHFILNWNKTSFAGTMAPSLAVYETQPLKSKLDIYWETSTNGLISELNDAIAVGDVVTPVKLTGLSGSLPEINHDEGMPTGQDITGPLFPTNAFGSPLSGPITASIISVDDNDANTGDQSHLFTINNSVPGYNNAFSIETNGYWMVDIFSNTSHTYTFTIKIDYPSSTYATGGGTIPTLSPHLTLGPYTVKNLPPYFVYDGDNVYDGTSGFIAKDDNPTQTATITTVYTTPIIDTSSMSYPALGGNIGWLDVPWYKNQNPWHENQYVASTNWLYTSNSSRIKTGNVETDIDSMYNTSLGEFTAPKTGNYNLLGHARVDARWWVAWYRNGSKQSQDADLTSCIACNLYLYNITTNSYINNVRFGITHHGEIKAWSKNFGPRPDGNGNGYWIPANKWSANPTSAGGANGYIDLGASWLSSSTTWGPPGFNVTYKNAALNAGDRIILGIYAGWLGSKEKVSGSGNKFNRPFVARTSSAKTYDGISQLQVTESTFSATSIEEIYYTNQTGDVYTFEVENGSNLSGGLEKDSIDFNNSHSQLTTYDEDGNVVSGLFSLRDNNNGSATLVKNARCAIGSYHVQIVARDVSGTGNPPTTFEAVVVITSLKP